MMHDMQNNDILDILYTKKQQTNNDMVDHHNLIETYPSISPAKSPLWETAPPTRSYRMLGQTYVSGWSRIIASQNGGSTSYIFPL